MDKEPNQPNVFVRYKREFAITEFVITEFDGMKKLKSYIYKLLKKSKNKTVNKTRSSCLNKVYLIGD